MIIDSEANLGLRNSTPAQALDQEVWKAFDGEDLKITFLDDHCKTVQTTPNDVWQHLGHALEVVGDQRQEGEEVST